jgi:excinuclease UvrABC helicase subunit UvrB
MKWNVWMFCKQDAEALKMELEKKCSLFKNQDHRNEDQTIIDKTRSSIKVLQTRMVVAIEAVDNGSRQVQRLRDEELYPQVLELLDG